MCLKESRWATAVRHWLHEVTAKFKMRISNQGRTSSSALRAQPLIMCATNRMNQDSQSGLPFSPPPPPKHLGWPSSSHTVKMVDGCSAWFTSCIFRLLVYFDVGREEINKQKNSGHRSGSTQDLWQRERTYLSNQIKEWTQLAVPMAATLLRTEERLWLLIFSQHILPNW